MLFPYCRNQVCNFYDISFFFEMLINVSFVTVIFKNTLNMQNCKNHGFPLVVDTLFALCIVVCDGFVLSPVGSWSYFRVFICFCTALLFHVLSSTVFVV